MPVPETFRTQNDLLDYLSLLEDRVVKLESENDELRTLFTSQKKELETELQMGAKQENIAQLVDSTLPQTGLLSRSLLTRAFAVLGHFLISTLILAIIVAVIYAIYLYLLLPYLRGLP